MKEARAYKVKHGYDVGDLITKYQWILQLAIDYIWGNIMWVEKEVKNYYIVLKSKKNIELLKLQGKRFKVYGRKIHVYYTAKRLIPKLPKSSKFMKDLRDYLQVFLETNSLRFSLRGFCHKNCILDLRVLERKLSKWEIRKE